MSKSNTVPTMQAGDVLFVKKTNLVGRIILAKEDIPTHFFCKNKNIYIRETRQFTHATIAHEAGIFLETGRKEGAVHSSIESILNSINDSDWKVLRNPSFIKNVNNGRLPSKCITHFDPNIFNYNLNQYLDTLYNIDFALDEYDEATKALFCSQLVTKILNDTSFLNNKNDKLLDSHIKNLGPNGLYMYLKLCKWDDVTAQYKAYLHRNRETFRDDRESFIKSHILIRTTNLMQSYTNLALTQDNKLYKRMPSLYNDRIAKPKTKKGKVYKRASILYEKSQLASKTVQSKNPLTDYTYKKPYIITQRKTISNTYISAMSYMKISQTIDHKMKFLNLYLETIILANTSYQILQSLTQKQLFDIQKKESLKTDFKQYCHRLSIYHTNALEFLRDTNKSQVWLTDSIKNHKNNMLAIAKALNISVDA